MDKVTKDFPYNTTHNIRVEGELVKKKQATKPSLSDIYNIVVKIDKRVDKLEGRFDKLEGRFDKLEGRFDKLERRFDKLEGRLVNLVLKNNLQE